MGWKRAFSEGVAKTDGFRLTTNGFRLTTRYGATDGVVDAAKPPATTFVNTSGMKFNTIHANNFHFYEELNQVIQAEPGDAFDAELVGLFASIGIKKGKPLAPDARMKSILTDAVAVGNAAARAIVFASRDERAKCYPDRQWFAGLVGGSYAFEDRARCAHVVSLLRDRHYTRDGRRQAGQRLRLCGSDSRGAGSLP
jgi:hypothetical protein